MIKNKQMTGIFLFAKENTAQNHAILKLPESASIDSIIRDIDREEGNYL